MTIKDILKAEDWKRLLKEKGESAVEDFGIAKGYVGEVKAGDSDERVLHFIISNEDVDRDSDTISVSGWDFAAWKKNPQVLFGHDHSNLPVAQGFGIKADRKARIVTSSAKFPDAEIYPFADTVYQMLLGKYLRATSVGFIPKKFSQVHEDERPWGLDFEKQELLEWSVVPVPSNPGALMRASKSGIALGPMKEWAEKVLDELAHVEDGARLLVPRATIETLWAGADEATGGRKTIIDLGSEKTCDDAQAASEAQEKENKALDEFGKAAGAAMKVDTDNAAESAEDAKEASNATEKGRTTQIEQTVTIWEDEDGESGKSGKSEGDDSIDAGGAARSSSSHDEKAAGLAAPDGDSSASLAAPPASSAFGVISWEDAHAGKEYGVGRIGKEWIFQKAALGGEEIFKYFFAAEHAKNAREAFAFEEPVDGCVCEDDATKSGSQFTFRHHENEKNWAVGAVVWGGLIEAMKSLLRIGGKYTADEKRGIYDHLAKHYRDDFDAEPPEFRFVEASVLRTLGDSYRFDDATGQVAEMSIHDRAVSVCAKALKRLRVFDGVEALDPLTRGAYELAIVSLEGVVSGEHKEIDIEESGHIIMLEDADEQSNKEKGISDSVLDLVEVGDEDAGGVNGGHDKEIDLDFAETDVSDMIEKSVRIKTTGSLD